MNNARLVFLLLFFYFNSMTAQTSDSLKMSNALFYIDASTFWPIYDLSQISAISGNLEGKILHSKRSIINLYGRAAFGRVREVGGIICGGTTNTHGVFLGLTLLVGKNGHHFELGGGRFFEFFNSSKKEECTFWSAQPFLTAPSSTGNVSIIEAGYRYQKPGKSSVFRLKIGTSGLGISGGYAF